MLISELNNDKKKWLLLRKRLLLLRMILVIFKEVLLQLGHTQNVKEMQYKSAKKRFHRSDPFVNVNESIIQLTQITESTIFDGSSKATSFFKIPWGGQ